MVAKIDGLIRAGQIEVARTQLIQLNSKKIKRNELQAVAHLMIRAGLLTEGLAALYPIVRPESGSGDATPLERATYALGLLKIGSHAECEEVLAATSGDLPQVSLYTGFVKQIQWDYAGSVAPLEKFIAHPQLADEYQRTIGKVNLVTGYIACGRFADAESMLSDLFTVTRENQWSLLFKNCQELTAQSAFRQKDWARAARILDEAAAARYAGSGLSDLLIEKWKIFTEIGRDPSPANLNVLLDFRLKCERMGHWESVRECDRTLALSLRDPQLLARVYFGTPYPSYRANLAAEAHAFLKTPEHYVLGTPDGRIFDLVQGRFADGSGQMAPGKNLHRLLYALTEDFYRPRHIGHLHSRIFPGEYFNPISSPGRVSNVIQRFRQWATGAKFHGQIEVENKFYRLTLAGSMGVQVPNPDAAPVNSAEAIGFDSFISRLNGGIAGTEFSSRDAIRALNVSKTVVIRVLNWGVEQGRLVREGNNRSTVYRIAGGGR